MKIIVFDKDGVLVDSVKEIFYEAVHAYGKVKNTKENFNKFKSLYPFAKTAEELFYVMSAVEENKGIKSIGKYNLKKAKQFKEKFYKSRKKLIKNDFQKWLRMVKPFRFAINAANSISRKYEVYISTTADKSSAIRQMEIFGIEIPSENVFSKEFSIEKGDHMNFISKKRNAMLSNIIFIDNSLEQLKSVRKLGCKVALASWGSNTVQAERAKKMGIKVLEKANLINTLSRNLRTSVRQMNAIESHTN